MMRVGSSLWRLKTWKHFLRCMNISNIILILMLELVLKNVQLMAYLYNNDSECYRISVIYDINATGNMFEVILKCLLYFTCILHVRLIKNKTPRVNFLCIFKGMMILLLIVFPRKIYLQMHLPVYKSFQWIIIFNQVNRINWLKFVHMCRRTSIHARKGCTWACTYLL